MYDKRTEWRSEHRKTNPLNQLSISDSFGYANPSRSVRLCLRALDMSHNLAKQNGT